MIRHYDKDLTVTITNSGAVISVLNNFSPNLYDFQSTIFRNSHFPIHSHWQGTIDTVFCTDSAVGSGAWKDLGLKPEIHLIIPI